jgi:hypothetical protein
VMDMCKVDVEIIARNVLRRRKRFDGAFDHLTKEVLTLAWVFGTLVATQALSAVQLANVGKLDHTGHILLTINQFIALHGKFLIIPVLVGALVIVPRVLRAKFFGDLVGTNKTIAEALDEGCTLSEAFSRAATFYPRRCIVSPNRSVVAHYLGSVSWYDQSNQMRRAFVNLSKRVNGGEPPHELMRSMGIRYPENVFRVLAEGYRTGRLADAFRLAAVDFQTLANQEMRFVHTAMLTTQTTLGFVFAACAAPGVMLLDLVTNIH